MAHAGIIFPSENDLQSLILYEELLTRGVKTALIPFNIYDSKIQVDRSGISIDGIDSFAAIYLRGLSIECPMMPPPYLNKFEYYLWKAKYLKENSKIDLWNGILSRLESSGALIINGIDKYMHHYTKMQMFQLLKMNGISVPETFATNDYFYYKENSKERTIAKSSTGVGATFVPDDNLSQEKLFLAPVLFQQFIEGSTIRIHTVANKIALALKIDSDDVDSRSDTKGFSYLELSEEHENQIVKANKLLGIEFSAWDAIIDDKGDIFLLDCNPGPYIGWIGPAFTRIVMSALADYIAAYIESKSKSTAAERIKTLKPNITEIKKQHHFVADILDSKIKEYKSHLNIRF